MYLWWCRSTWEHIPVRSRFSALTAASDSHTPAHTVVTWPLAPAADITACWLEPEIHLLRRRREVAVAREEFCRRRKAVRRRCISSLYRSTEFNCSLSSWRELASEPTQRWTIRRLRTMTSKRRHQLMTSSLTSRMTRAVKQRTRKQWVRDKKPPGAGWTRWQPSLTDYVKRCWTKKLLNMDKPITAPN